METAAQRESVPHYPPRLPADPGSITTCGSDPARIPSAEQLLHSFTSQRRDGAGSGLASSSGGNARGKTNCSLPQQAEEASSESWEQGWLLQV